MKSNVVFRIFAILGLYQLFATLSPAICHLQASTRGADGKKQGATTPAMGPTQGLAAMASTTQRGGFPATATARRPRGTARANMPTAELLAIVPGRSTAPERRTRSGGSPIVAPAPLSTGRCSTPAVGSPAIIPAQGSAGIAGNTATWRSLAMAPDLAPGLSPTEVYASMDPAERQALFAVMNAMAEGEDWSTTHPDACGEGIWHGLECSGPLDSDPDLHVVTLTFGLLNPLDPNPACRYDAYIPNDIEQLTFLENLLIFGCFVHTETTLPSSLGRLTSLEIIDMRNNSKLVGPIPSELGNLPNLQALNLLLNGISGRIPELRNLQSLEELDLSYNNLNGPIPPSVGQLSMLQILSLRGNQLQGLIPSTLGELKNLKKLDLGENELQGSLPRSLGDLSFLILLAVDNNKLIHGLPESFGNLVSLQYLIAHGNPMHSRLPAFWGKMGDNLVYLSLANSSYNGSIPGSIGDIGNLTYVGLNDNELTGEIPEEFENLSQLSLLNLSGNNLSGPVPFSAAFLDNLGSGLILDHNPALCELPSSKTTPTGKLRLRPCTESDGTYPNPWAPPSPAPHAAMPSIATPSNDNQKTPESNNRISSAQCSSVFQAGIAILLTPCLSLLHIYDLASFPL